MFAVYAADRAYLISMPKQTCYIFGVTDLKSCLEKYLNEVPAWLAESREIFKNSDWADSLKVQMSVSLQRLGRTRLMYFILTQMSVCKTKA